LPDGESFARVRSRSVILAGLFLRVLPTALATVRAPRTLSEEVARIIGGVGSVRELAAPWDWVSASSS
jgi:hypothetical protein